MMWHWGENEGYAEDYRVVRQGSGDDDWVIGSGLTDNNREVVSGCKEDNRVSGQGSEENDVKSLRDMIRGVFEGLRDWTIDKLFCARCLRVRFGIGHMMSCDRD